MVQHVVALQGDTWRGVAGLDGVCKGVAKQVGLSLFD